MATDYGKIIEWFSAKNLDYKDWTKIDEKKFKDELKGILDKNSPVGDKRQDTMKFLIDTRINEFIDASDLREVVDRNNEKYFEATKREISESRTSSKLKEIEIDKKYEDKTRRELIKAKQQEGRRIADMELFGRRYETAKRIKGSGDVRSALQEQMPVSVRISEKRVIERFNLDRFPDGQDVARDIVAAVRKQYAEED